MTRRFAVRTVPRFDRLLRHLSSRHPELVAIYAKALKLLELDPHNTSRTHPIRKLERVARDEGGQYRLRLGRFRFRYDIEGHAVAPRRLPPPGGSVTVGTGGNGGWPSSRSANWTSAPSPP